MCKGNPSCMEIITKLLSYFWYEIFFVVIGIVVVYRSFQKFYPYIPNNISDSVPQDFEDYFQSHEEVLFNLDWICLGIFNCTHPKNQNIIIARFFCSPNSDHAAMLAQCKAADGNIEYIIEFCSELSPCGSISTNNNPYPDSIAHQKTKFIFKFPWISSVNILHDYHLSFCQAAQSESFTLKKFKPEGLEDYIYNIFKRDYEFQVKKGRMKKVDESVYAWTIRGVILAVPIQAIYFLHSYLFRLYRPKQTTLIERMRKKLAKIRQE